MLNPTVLVMLAAAAVLILVLRRKHVVIPLLFVAILTPFGQHVNLGGIHFYVPRALILCALVRLALASFSSKEPVIPGGFTRIDSVFVVWGIARFFTTILLFMDSQAVINQVGFLLDTVGWYFVLRFLIRDEEDIARTLKVLVCLTIILASTMSFEHVNRENLFGRLGGSTIAIMRDGKVRSQGPFEGPIPAGIFGSTLLCLFLWLWKKGERGFGAVGALCSATIVVTAVSSTPLLGFASGILAVALWPMRNGMRAIRWGIVFTLIVLQIVMKSPVWFAINHIDLTGGNSSYHRAMLIDGFIRHFSDWWLIGIKSSANWGYDLWDQANQFVKEGLSGGLPAFISFIWLISRCFGHLGRRRRLAEQNHVQPWLFWLLGGALLSQIVCFFGNSYSDQSYIGWFILLALISLAVSPVFEPKADTAEPATEQQPDECVFHGA